MQRSHCHNHPVLMCGAPRSILRPFGRQVGVLIVCKHRIRPTGRFVTHVLLECRTWPQTANSSIGGWCLPAVRVTRGGYCRAALRMLADRLGVIAHPSALRLVRPRTDYSEDAPAPRLSGRRHLSARAYVLHLDTPDQLRQYCDVFASPAMPDHPSWEDIPALPEEEWAGKLVWFAVPGYPANTISTFAKLAIWQAVPADAPYDM